MSLPCRYRHLEPTTEQVTRGAYLQYLAWHQPRKLKIPRDWVPRTVLDRRIASILVHRKPAGEI